MVSQNTKTALKAKDVQIAELQGKVANAAKTTEATEALNAEIAALKRQMADELVEFALKAAGARSVKVAKAFLEDSLLPPPLTVRLNTTRATADDLAPFGAKACPQAEGAYVLEAADAVHSEAFKKGLFHVQDLAPQICCALLGARPGETVLDVCAAPGGKSFTIAERMEDRGHVYAFDLYPQRVGLIRDGAQRLGLTCIRADVQDATQHRDDMPLADRILCDVPCSGFGVIRRKPEIKYTPLDQAAALPEIQYQILETAAQYLRPGGTLVYATCTVLRAENEDVVARFLASHLDFSLAPLTERGQTAGQMTFLPQHHGSDGFFAARLVRAAKEG